MTQPTENKPPAESAKSELTPDQETALMNVVKKALSSWQADETQRRTEADANAPKKKTLLQQIFSDD